MAKLSHDDLTDAPLPKVFDYLADSRNLQQWFHGIQSVDPLTDQIRGLGSTYAIAINAGKVLTATIRCTEFAENELIAVETVGGLTASSRWTFAEEHGGTRIHGEFEYTLPGGVSGIALGQLIRPFAAIAVKQTSANLLKYAGR